ncbi:hypothetical protein MJT46_017923 [Ovis ammon polii x Ovis aries]|nr:hypothetical protein MJT46_017923 [Ovis ammon polii x Ovis aries]
MMKMEDGSLTDVPPPLFLPELAMTLESIMGPKHGSQRALGRNVAEIREAFRVLDRDGNGFISKQELGMAMRSLGYMPSEVELAIIMQRLDMDGSPLSGWFSAENYTGFYSYDIAFSSL